jgi:hypothetical protein
VTAVEGLNAVSWSRANRTAEVERTPLQSQRKRDSLRAGLATSAALAGAETSAVDIAVSEPSNAD